MKSSKGLVMLFGALVLMTFTTLAEAAPCRWTVTGRVVDGRGKAFAGLKVKIRARWAQPSGPWNDTNWPDPVTDADGRFSVRSKKVNPCAKKRDLEVQLLKGKKWVRVKTRKKQARGTVDFGTIRGKFLRQARASKSPSLRRTCSNDRTRALAEACEGDVSRCRGKIKFNRRSVPYFRTHAIGKPQRKITRAVVVFHGNARTAESYFKNGLAGVSQGCKLDSTVVIAPHFLAKYAWKEGDEGMPPDSPAKHQVYWPNNSGWKRGGDSSPESGVVISSFDVIDRILNRLGDRKNFPKLKTVVLIGHSAGGQVVQRYAGANQVQQTLQHLDVKYVVSNPSSYTYLNPLRLHGNATADWRKPKGCRSYDRYRYGLVGGLNRYLAKTGASKFRKQFSSRKVVYFLGTEDILQDDTLDKSCQAKLQGKNRYRRGYNMLRFMHQFYSKHKHRLYEVEVGHDGGQMLRSTTGSWLMTAW